MNHVMKGVIQTVNFKRIPVSLTAFSERKTTFMACHTTLR